MRALPLFLGIALAACGSTGPAEAVAPAPPSPPKELEPASGSNPQAEAPKLSEDGRFRIDRDGPNLLVKPAKGECPWLEYAPEWKSLRFRSDRVGCEVVRLSDHERDLVEMLQWLKTHLGQAATPESFASFGLNQYPELYERLALQCLRSKRWDKQKGKPQDEGQSVNAFVVAEAQDPEHYSEVVRVFGSLGYRPRLSSVEKVFVGPPRDTAFSAALHKAGARPSDRVPYDSMIHFKLGPML